MELGGQRQDKSITWGDLLFLMVLSFGICLFYYPRLSHPTWEMYDSWRQSDTLAMARNMLKTGNFFKPMLNYDGLQGNYVQLELPILPALTCLLLPTGLDIHYLARAISMVFYLASCIYFYLLANQLFSKGASRFASLFYVLAPLTLKYGRAIMPESLVLCFFIGSLYHLYRFHESGSLVQFYLTGIFTSLTILQKIPGAFTGLLILYVVFKKWGFKKTFKSPHTYIFGLISLGLPLLYFYQASQNSTTNYVNGIASLGIFGSKDLRAFFLGGLNFLRASYKTTFSPVLLVLAGLGFLLVLYHRRDFLLGLFLAYSLELVFIVFSIKFQYYMVFHVVVLALLAGEYFNYFSYSKYKFITFICSLLVLVHGYYGIKDYLAMTKVNEKLDREIHALQEKEYLKDKVAINGANPIYLNGILSYGYRADVPQIRDYPWEPEAQIAFFKDQGVRYYVSIKDQAREDYDRYYMDRFQVIDQGPDFSIYDLERQK